MTRQIFPTLPAELRNHIYSYTSAPSATHTSQQAHTAGLAFTAKTYEICHTTITISAVHNGSLGLLALRKYNVPEAHEYHNWLLTHGLEILVAVHFHGCLDKFIQKHWDEKVQRSLKKLVVKYKWLAKTAKWNVRIVWEPKTYSFPLGSEALFGQISHAMTSTILGFQDAWVRAARGDVKVCVYLTNWVVAVVKASWGTLAVLEFESFLHGEETKAKSERRQVAVQVVDEEDEKPRSGLVPVRDVLRKKMVLEVEGGRVKWGGWMREQVVAEGGTAE